jgi:hypothetical protein
MVKILGYICREFGMRFFVRRYGKLSRLFCLLLSVHILNCSIDPRDREPSFIPEDLSINEIESIAEFFAESVFGFKNAIPEHDEADTDHGTIDLNKIFISAITAPLCPSPTVDTIHREYFIPNDNRPGIVSAEKSSPPPKA